MNRIGLTKSIKSIKNLLNWSVLSALHLILFVKCHSMTLCQSYLSPDSDFQFVEHFVSSQCQSSAGPKTYTKLLFVCSQSDLFS